MRPEVAKRAVREARIDWITNLFGACWALFWALAIAFIWEPMIGNLYYAALLLLMWAYYWPMSRRSRAKYRYLKEEV